MSRNYKFHNPKGVYFVSFAVIEWLDMFTRNEYKDIFLDSLRFSFIETTGKDWLRRTHVSCGGGGFTLNTGH